ncbi:MAG: hypothetical protein A4E40_01217 [Methanoregulaceae archaeon PtaU1.Bin059]|nr:MAG: hypothetical protein A4E40_01217 [Methanoregulaceae archaeon PtaU1.Bin059]
MPCALQGGHELPRIMCQDKAAVLWHIGAHRDILVEPDSRADAADAREGVAEERRGGDPNASEEPGGFQGSSGNHHEVVMILLRPAPDTRNLTAPGKYPGNGLLSQHLRTVSACCVDEPGRVPPCLNRAPETAPPVLAAPAGIDELGHLPDQEPEPGGGIHQPAGPFPDEGIGQFLHPELLLRFGEFRSKIDPESPQFVLQAAHGIACRDHGRAAEAAGPHQLHPGIHVRVVAVGILLRDLRPLLDQEDPVASLGKLLCHRCTASPGTYHDSHT